MPPKLSELLITAGQSFQEAIAQLDRTRLGILLVVDEAQRLTGTMTDGDMRRAILAKLDLHEPLSTLLARKRRTRFERPITALVGADPKTYRELLQQHRILQLPLLDPDGRVVDLVRIEDFVTDHPLPVQAVVMAGGVGSRLRPLTEEVPKPMLLVGDRPLMEILIEQLREAGIRHVTVTTHYQPNKIAEHFGDGSQLGVQLSYIEEEQPLGTAGGLSLLPPPAGTTLVINGDVLTRVDFRAMLAFHREHQAELTVGVRHYEVAVPYGVIECDGPTVRGVSEKPTLGLLVNAGIYLLEPAVYRQIPRGQRLDMTELIQRLVKEGRPVVSFPICEYWLDVGQPEDYRQIHEDLRSGKVKL